MEFIQFHPSALYQKDSPKAILISEAVRGEGAHLLDKRGKRFMVPIHELAELAPRDIVARSIFKQMIKDDVQHVTLSLRHLNREKILKRFPGIYAKCQEYGHDLTQEIPVAPAAHYTVGGIASNHNGRTDIERLYVCGEIAATGIMGANRLASNSLTEAVVYPERAVRHALKSLHKVEWQEGIPDWDFEGTAEAEEMVLVLQNRKELQNIMSNYVGIVRSNLRLERAMKRLTIIWQETEGLYNRTKPCRELCELRNMIAVAYLTIKQARECHESVGLHYTIDYPPKNN
jgi:L-aspartate oxidase